MISKRDICPIILLKEACNLANDVILTIHSLLNTAIHKYNYWKSFVQNFFQENYLSFLLDLEQFY